MESGRTSTIAHEIVGFDSKGEIVNYRGVRMPSWPEICSQSSKVVTFFDLAGKELNRTEYRQNKKKPLEGECIYSFVTFMID